MTPGESVRFTLLDQQIVDREQRPVGRVDDLLLDLGEPGEQPAVTDLLVGAQALGERLGGATGRLMARLAARLRPPTAPPGPARIPVRLVGDHRDLVHLRVPLRDLPQIARLEAWLAEEVLRHVPGGDDEDQ